MSKRKKNWLPYFMVSPYLIHLLAFTAFPVIFSLLLTFFKWNIIGPMEWNGIGNWERLFSDRLFWKAILNTFKFLAIHIPLQIAVALQARLANPVGRDAPAARGFNPPGMARDIRPGA